MAIKVPQQLPTVSARPLGGQLQQFDTRGAFGDAVAEGLRATGNAIGKLGQQIDDAQRKNKEEDQATAISAGMTALEADANREMYDPENGYLAKRGSNAVGDRTPLWERLTKRQKEIEDSLPDDTSRKIYRQRSDNMMLGLQRQIDGHASRQNEAMKDDAFKAREKTLLDAIQLGDESAYNEKRAELRDWSLVEANRDGKLYPSKTDFLAEQEGKAAAARIDGLLSPRKDAATGEVRVNAAEAKRFLDSSVDVGGVSVPVRKLLGTREDEYAKKVTDASYKIESDEMATRHFSVGREKGGLWADAETARASLELEETDGPVKQMALEKLERRLDLDRQNRDQQADDVYAKGLAAFKNRSVLADVPADVMRYLDNPANGRHAVELGLRLREAAKSAEKKRGWSAKGDAKSQKEANERALAYYGYRSAEDKANAYKMDLDGDPILSAADETTRYKILAAQQKDKRLVDGGGMARYQPSLGFFKRALEPLKLSKKKEEDALRQFDTWFQTEDAKRKGEPITQAEVNAKVGRMLMLGDSEGGGGSWWSKDKRRFQVKDGEQWAPLDAQDNDLSRSELENMRAEPKKQTQQSQPAPTRQPTNKGALIRAIVEEHPDWGPAEVTAELNLRRAQLQADADVDGAK